MVASVRPLIALLVQVTDLFDADEKDDIDEYLLFADYINILRGGKKSPKLEKCGYIFLSESKLSTKFSKFLRENDTDARTFVICRMSRFTEEMWFKLRKGIVDQKSIATLKVISKAKSIVSGLLSDSVSNNYKKILEEGQDPEEKKILYAELRDKRHTPENVTSDSIDLDISFILDKDFVTNYRENQSLLKIRAEKADDVERKLDESQRENNSLKDENHELRKKIKKHAYDSLCQSRKKAKRKFALESLVLSNAKICLWIIIAILLVICLYFEWGDIKSPLGIVSGIATVIAFGFQQFGDIHIRALRYMRKRYRYYIEKEFAT